MAQNQKKKTTKAVKKATTKSTPKGSSKKATQRQSTSKKQSAKQLELKPKMNPQVKAIILFALGLIVLCLIFISGASVWNWLRNVTYGILGVTMLVFAGVIFYVAISTARGKEVSHSKIKVTFCIALVVLSCMEFYMFSSTLPKSGNYFSVLGSLFMNGFSGSGIFDRGPGLIGGLIGYPLIAACGNMVAGIITTIILGVMILLVTGVSLLDIGNGFKKTATGVVNSADKIKDKRTVRKAEKEIENNSYDSDDIYKDNSFVEIKLDKKHKKTKHNDDSPSIIEQLHITDYTAPEKTDLSDNNQETHDEPHTADDLINAVGSVNRLGKDFTASDVAKKITKRRKKPLFSGDEEEIQDIESVATTKEETAVVVKETLNKAEFVNEVQKMSSEISNTQSTEVVAYKYPPVQLLSLAKPVSKNARQELQENADKLVSTLQSFNVNVTITDISRGPSVTRYELQPAPGVKISKITNLADDIALNLAANGVRIEAPIPGKAAVGIEVPNKIVNTVSMRELIDSDQFDNSQSKLTCVLGRDISGQIVTTDLAKMPHLLIAGTTGAGKSVCVNSLIISILYKANPDEVKFLLIDPKMVEFSKYKGIPHLLVPVVSDAKKAAGALGWAVTEMLNRYKMFAAYECKDIDSYNALIESNIKYAADNPPAEGEEQEVLNVSGLPVPLEKMPKIVIAIDELADLMMAAPSEVEDSICRLAQMARAAGMHLVIATQRPSVNVITGVIKANIPSRIALRVSSNIDSRTILDVGGAEKLIGRGDMLFSPVGAPKPMRVQGCYASDTEIEKVTSYIKKKANAQYNMEVEEKIKKITSEGLENDKKSSENTINGREVDDKMEEAIKIVIDAGQASTSLLQRKMKVGYARAGRMVDDMEQMGIVGPHQGSKPREVLISYSQWLERNNIQGE